MCDKSEDNQLVKYLLARCEMISDDLGRHMWEKNKNDQSKRSFVAS